ncbi:DUF4222 domain-containing protein [Enterobacter soli]|uniref:DUF4222 domain-containing protein n=1 Tax=Enterobacter soli TaxID=885040 RepID=UPI0023793788|nr:DUF4222 domain-containing protein [Enterobacter soli]MDD9246571.1 DUF4222 domain-containing protein [Enterobacter soli]
MKKKNSGLTAAGQTQPEILPGDIYKDNRGERVTVQKVTGNRITFIRDGYTGECISSVLRFEKEFQPVVKQTFSEWCRATDTAGKIQNLREIIAAKRAEK